MEMSERGGPLPSENSQTMQVVGKKTREKGRYQEAYIVSFQVESGF